MSTPPQGYQANSVEISGPVVGGTANGVLYVNSSGNLASGSAFTFDGTNVAFTGQMLAPNGSASAPSYSFASGTNYGMYVNTSNQTLRFSVGGTERFVQGGARTYLEPTTGVVIGNGASLSFDSAGGDGDLFLFRDAAGILHQRNSTNAQILRVANTYTSASVFEAFEVNWAATANTCALRTMHTGASARSLVIEYGNTTTHAAIIGTSPAGGIRLGEGSTGSAGARVRIANSFAFTATSGTCDELLIDGQAAPTSTSTMVFRGVSLAPTINYSAGTPGAGQIKLLHFNPTNTALPTGLNAACVFSASASTLGGMIFHNQSDEATNYEIGQLQFASNIFTIGSVKGGSGTLRGIMLGVTNNAVGFMGASPVTRQTSGADLTNNVTAGGSDDTIADFTSLTVYATDAAAIRNDIYQLARKLKQVNDALRDFGLLT